MLLSALSLICIDVYYILWHCYCQSHDSKNSKERLRFYYGSGTHFSVTEQILFLSFLSYKMEIVIYESHKLFWKLSDIVHIMSFLEK